MLYSRSLSVIHLKYSSVFLLISNSPSPLSYPHLCLLHPQAAVWEDTGNSFGETATRTGARKRAGDSESQKFWSSRDPEARFPPRLFNNMNHFSFGLNLFQLGFHHLRSRVVTSVSCFRFCPPCLSETNLFSLPSYWQVPSIPSSSILLSPWGKLAKEQITSKLNTSTLLCIPSLGKWEAWRADSRSYSLPASGLQTCWFRVWGGLCSFAMEKG